MAGIYGVLLKNSYQRNICGNFYNSNFENTIQEEIVFNNFCFGRSVLKKFEQDRFLYEDEYYLICFEGINYSSIKTPKDIITAYRKYGDDFIKKIKGNFSCFFYDKQARNLKVFTDPLASKSIYYFYDKNFGFAFASEMHVLSKLLRENKIPITYDYDGIYSLALYGQMFNDFTLVKEIKKINYGSILAYDAKINELTQKKHYQFFKKQEKQSTDEVVENLNSLMTSAIHEEWQKDVDNGYQEHFAFISGGMDSRVNSLIAKEMGFQKINAFTYGNPTSSDVKIADRIAKANFYSHLQYNLHHGSFLNENILENYVKATDGLTHFTANAIIYNAMLRVNCDRYGLGHSGQLGDTVSGSFLKPNFNFKANKDKIGLTGFVNHPELLKKLSFLDDLINRYNSSDYELFAYEQRQVNGTLMGDKVFNNFIDLSSPFYSVEVLNYILSIPNKFKVNQRIYFEWLQKKHPQLLAYKWEKIGLKPNSNFNLKYGRLFKKYKNGGKKYIGVKYDSMNPITNWIQAKPIILKKFDQLLEDNIGFIREEELQKDLTKIYRDDIFEYRNRFAVLTVVLAIRLHFES